MTIKIKRLTTNVTDFKYDVDTGEFTCYGNTKNLIDKVKDRAVDGCYQNSIDRHKSAGTMPKMFWSHNPFLLPVGKWVDMQEDKKGLFMRGKMSETTMGKDIRILAKDGALDSFSIGYIEEESRYNTALKCNDLIKIDIREASWVNFACNEESMLESIKSELAGNKVPTQRELQNLLREFGLSKSHAERICNFYKPQIETKKFDINLLKSNPLFQ